MIFGYTFPEVRKSVISFAVFFLTTLALIVVYDPGIKDAIIIVLGNGFAVAAVFMAPKVSVEDLTKTVGQLVGSVQTLLTFFIVIDPSVWVVIGSVISLIPIGYAVWKTKNLEPISMLTPAPEFFGPPLPSDVLIAKRAEAQPPPPTTPPAGVGG